MAKTIVIRDPSWLERHPVQIRRLLVRLIFSLGAQQGWQIVMDKQRWRDSNPVNDHAQATKDVGITDQEWAMLMGHK